MEKSELLCGLMIIKEHEKGVGNNATVKFVGAAIDFIKAAGQSPRDDKGFSESGTVEGKGEQEVVVLQSPEIIDEMKQHIQKMENYAIKYRWANRSGNLHRCALIDKDIEILTRMVGGLRDE